VVVFAQSVVQIQGIDLIIQAEPAAGLPLTQTHAVIRYGLAPVEGLLSGGLPFLQLRYRSGRGRVVAVLIEVDISTGTETPWVRFDSQDFPSGNAFQVQRSEPALSGSFDFETRAYYIELTLSATSHPGLPVLFPPKVSVVQVQLQLE
jgi:hypothetical protein